jgi:hypothetical protein
LLFGHLSCRAKSAQPAGLGVNVTIVYFEFSIPIFMFATAVEGVARLYRLRIMEFLIANRARPVALHRTAK